MDFFVWFDCHDFLYYSINFFLKQNTVVIFFRAISADSDAICDIIPVDTVINLMCAVAFKTAEQGPD